MKPEMHQKLAREPFEEKIRKVAQLIQLSKNSLTASLVRQPPVPEKRG